MRQASLDRCFNFTLDSNKKILIERSSICFSSMSNTITTHPETKYFGNYYVSNLSLEDTNKYINLFKAMGLFKNVKVTFLSNENFPLTTVIDTVKPTEKSIIPSLVKFKIWADITKCSYQEYKSVGFIIRNLMVAPDLCLGWFKLMEMYPKQNKLVLWSLAHTVDFYHGTKRREFIYLSKGNSEYYPFSNGHLALPTSVDGLYNNNIKAMFKTLRNSYKVIALCNKERDNFFKKSFTSFFVCPVAIYNNPKNPYSSGNTKYETRKVEWLLNNIKEGDYVSKVS